MFIPGDVRRFAEAFLTSGAAGAIAARRDPPPVPAHRDAVRIVAGLVEKLIDDDPANPLGSAPLWALGQAIAPFLEGLTGPPFELAEAFERALASKVHVAGIEIGRTRDLTHPADVVKENFPYLGP